ncbi:LolA family protein [Photobacterium leiognathi]|uniref:LolA family protein n=1 Tax=Photobacterium leiognathi TaxID=553611 RepID=UPI002733490F|nr:outer membrane lipoprotein carrier protein LolA [Photobacterium leiognathi]
MPTMRDKTRFSHGFKRALKATLAASALALTSLSAHAITLEQLQKNLSSAPLVRGDFTQKREMAMFDQPLLSSGQFLLSAKNGLWWHQTQPMPVSLVLTQDKLSQQFDNQPAQVLSASDNPMVFYFSHVFLSLFKGDTSQLTEQFDLSLKEIKDSTTNNQWQLVLTPKAAPLDKVFSKIEIEGGKFINELELDEIRGDKTIITFSQQKTTPTTLTSEEQRVFQF